MEVQEEVLSVERSGEMTESSFKIKASAKAFRILSSGLYSNKVRAIVRELSTNAYDSHVVYDVQDKPFTVHLPNSLEPWFSIRDYGTGLSPQDVVGIYTTYFESNKTQSNDLVGCMGLGSKSPFSYTDNFVVTSFYNGTKYTYNAFINEHGCPAIACFAREFTGEANGLAVQLAVSPNDFYKFVEEARNVYKYFQVRPVVVGQTLAYAIEPQSLISEANWELFPAYNQSVVLMGNVAYPLDIHQACQELDLRGIFNCYSIKLRLQIGEAEMTASRESLEYTPKTIANIRKNVEECVNKFSEKIQEELAKQATLWDATKFYDQNSMFLPHGVLWHGLCVGCSIDLTTEQKTSFFENGYGYSGRIRMRREKYVRRINPAKAPLLVINNLQRGAIERTKSYMKDKGTKSAYLFKFDTAEQQAEFVADLGTPLPEGILFLASQLPKPPRSASQSVSPKDRPQAYEFSPSGDTPTKVWNEVEDFDVNDGGVYVELDRWTPVGFDTYEKLGNIYQKLKSLNAYSEPIIGLRSNLAKLARQLPQWRSFASLVEEVCQTALADAEMIANYGVYKEYTRILTIKVPPTAIDLQEFYDKVAYCEKNEIKLHNQENLLRSRNYSDRLVMSDNVQTNLVKLKEKYGLLFFVLENCYYSSMSADIQKKLADYVSTLNT